MLRGQGQKICTRCVFTLTHKYKNILITGTNRQNHRQALIILLSLYNHVHVTFYILFDIVDYFYRTCVVIPTLHLSESYFERNQSSHLLWSTLGRLG